MLVPTPHRRRHSQLTQGSVGRAKKLGIMQNQHTISPLEKKSTDWHASRNPNKPSQTGFKSNTKKEFWR